MTDSASDQDTTAQRLKSLLARAGLTPSAEDMEKITALVIENQNSAARVRGMFSRYDEPANAFPARRRIPDLGEGLRG